MSRNDISRQLGISRNTVRTIIDNKGEMPASTRRDKIRIDEDLLRRLYEECDGRIQRVHEKLVEEEGIQVKYSTLTRILRNLGIGRTPKTRCDRVPDEPGAEMQHDTSKYLIPLAGIGVWLIASLLYLRYSKRKYLQFYRAFNRFRMKCFFHEALMSWKHAARICIIDNTNLARLRGTGKNAVIVPEMEAFGKQYGFRFICHEKGHCNRKAGDERGLYTVETNFLPGRHFESEEDLNQQAFEWSTVRMDNRPMAKTGLIPAKAFEHERSYLLKLPPHLPPPYQVHERATDQYGYASFEGNYYWVPGTKRDDVRVLEYSDRLKIYLSRECLAEYQLPVDGVKNQRFSPEGMPKPQHQPNNRKRPTAEEEKRLRGMSQAVDAYLDFALKGDFGIQRHRFVRELFALMSRMTSSVFNQTIERALHYGITGIGTLERIALQYMSQGEHLLPCVDADESFRQREAYLEGRLTDAPDFSIYDKILEGNNG
jgi:transposase